MRRRRNDCGCQFVVPVGGSRIAWLDGDSRPLIADLADASPAARRTDITVPTEEGTVDERVAPR